MENEDTKQEEGRSPSMFFVEDEKIEPSREFFLFELDKELYAVAVSDVDQIMKIPPITAVPNSPNAILGIFHLRGRVIVAIDLLKRMNLARTTELSPFYLFVAHHEKNYFAIVIDRIRTVVRILESKIVALDPVIAAHIPARYAEGMFMYEDKELQKKKTSGTSIMIESNAPEEASSDADYPIRPVLWLNIAELLNQEDLLGVSKVADNMGDAA